MPAIKFTDATVRNLKPREVRFEVSESQGKGNGKLALRVSPSGAKSWQYLFTLNGQDRRLTLGAYPTMTVAEAHAACGEAMRKRAAGVDPGAVAVEANAAERKAPTFATLAAEYLAQYATNKKDGGDRDRATLDRDVLPGWRTLKAESIQRKDVRALLQTIVDRGAPIQANRTLALVRKMFNWAMGQDLVTHNPCDRLPAPGKETQSDRVLTEAELRATLAGLSSAAMSDESKLALRLLLLTAQRCGEVLALRWDEIDRANGWWTIPAAKAKNKLAHRVPLSPQALAVLAEAEALNPDRKTVFPSPRGDKPMVETAVAYAVRRNVDHFTAKGRELFKDDAFAVQYFSPHDLRRTAASLMTGNDVARLVVSKILNHVERGVTKVYDRHSYDREKREALDAWGAKVAGLMPKAGGDAPVAPVAAQSAVTPIEAGRGRAGLRLVREA